MFSVSLSQRGFSPTSAKTLLPLPPYIPPRTLYASFPTMASVGGKRFSLSGSSSSKDEGILTRVSRSSIVTKGKQAACGATYVGKRLAKSTGKAAWIVATTFLVLGLPLIIVMDREQQLNDLDLQQASLLGAPPASAVAPQK